MRCTYSLCQSSNTKLVGRTLQLTLGGNKIINAHINELWFCNDCLNVFQPGVSRIPKWFIPLGRQQRLAKRYGIIPKSWIIEELFRNL